VDKLPWWGRLEWQSLCGYRSYRVVSWCAFDWYIKEVPPMYLVGPGATSRSPFCILHVQKLAPCSDLLQDLSWPNWCALCKKLQGERNCINARGFTDKLKHGNNKCGRFLSVLSQGPKTRRCQPLAPWLLFLPAQQVALS